MNEAAPISFVQLAVSAVLVLAAGGVSLAMRLGLERQLALASVRTVAQLLLVGTILGWVFSVDEPLVVLGITLVMTGLAARAALTRSSRSFSGAFFGIFGTLATVGLTTTVMATQVVLRVEPWYRPQYLIPLLGMVLGNSLTGVSLCLDELMSRFDEQRGRVEMELAMGATRWEAARGPLREAVRRGMIPIINSMMVVGLVSLPGMMTGQILQGGDPLIAVRYQIVIMFMVAAATAFGCMGVGLLTYQRMFSARHQLRSDRIVRRPR